MLTAFPEAVFVLSLLEDLDVSWQENSAVVALPDRFGELPHLKRLALDGLDFAHLPDTIPDGLQELSVDSTNLRRLPMPLPPRLSKLRLKVLSNLDHGSFEAVRAVAATLTVLDLCTCSEIGVDEDALEIICGCTNLETLQLCCVHLSKVPEKFVQLTKVRAVAPL